MWTRSLRWRSGNGTLAEVRPLSRPQRRWVGNAGYTAAKASEQPRDDDWREVPYVGWLAACHASRMACGVRRLGGSSSRPSISTR